MHIHYTDDNGTRHTAFINPDLEITPEILSGLGWPSYEAMTPEEVAELTKPPLEATRAEKLAEIMAGYSAAFAPIEAIYPQEERETWPIQLEEARAVLADPGAETPMLSIMVAVRGKGESVAEFARAVMVNNAAYRQLAAYLTGLQQRMYAEVSALTDVDAILAYPVAYAMPEGLGHGA